MEAAADVVAHAADRHRARGEDHLQAVVVSCAGVLAQEEQQLARPRDFGASPKPPLRIGRSELPDDLRQRLADGT